MIKRPKMSMRRIDGYLKLSRLLQWGRANPIYFVRDVYGVSLLDFQKYAFMNSWVTPFCVWCMGRNGGKALALDTKIPTPTGFKTMGELQVGDYVFDESGRPTKVNYVSDIFLNNKCYKIYFEDGEEIVADADHLWSIVSTQDTKRAIKTTDEIAKVVTHKKNDNMAVAHTYSVPMSSSINCTHKDLPIHPYLLGLWLCGSGMHDTTVTCDCADLANVALNINAVGHTAQISYNQNGVVLISIGETSEWPENKFKTVLSKLGLVDINLINNRFIPEMYLYSSIEQRLDLLRGIMDICGSYNVNTHECEFLQNDYNLALQVSQLLSSLGIKHTLRGGTTTYNNEKYKSYKITFCAYKNFSCFKLSRKHDKLPDEKPVKEEHKNIVAIKEVPSVPTKCISVDADSKLYLCGEKFTVTHNTTLGAIYIMTRTLLIPNHQTYILAASGPQAKETFLKIEQIAKRNIASFTGLTDVFANETVKSASNTTGFTHDPTSFKTSLYHGAAISTLNSVEDRARSRRSNCNFYEESGFASEELFTATLPFITQNSDFRLGGGVDVTLMPKQFPNQVIFASSASSMDTYFYGRYKEFSKKMYLGDKRYFVADINSDAIIGATFNGVLYPVPLLTQATIDSAMSQNKEKAMREYKNIFTNEGSDSQIIKRAAIIRNSKVYAPIMGNPSNRKFAFAIDPARTQDNSICTSAEYINDPHVGWRMQLANCVSFSDINRRKKTPMKTPDQIEHFKRMLLDMNGKAPDYENIMSIMIDVGEGGGGRSAWADNLLGDWFDASGKPHKGIIDASSEEYDAYVGQYPGARKILKMLSPQKYKKILFDALIEMMELDLITFPDTYDGKGYLLLPDADGELKQYRLSADEELNLLQFDLAREELVSIYKFKSSNGNVRYDLPPEKQKKMGDDRAYTIAMLAWFLLQLRRNYITQKKPNVDISDFCFISTPKQIKV